MFQQNHVQLLKDSAAALSSPFEDKKIETEIDGCHITMSFPASANSTALENVRGILKSVYFKSLSN